MLTEFRIRKPASCNSATMHWPVSSSYEWKSTVPTGTNASVGSIVLTFTQRVP